MPLMAYACQARRVHPYIVVAQWLGRGPPCTISWRQHKSGLEESCFKVAQRSRIQTSIFQSSLWSGRQATIRATVGEIGSSMAFAVEQLTCSSILPAAPRKVACSPPCLEPFLFTVTRTSRNGDAFVHPRNDDLRTRAHSLLVAQESLSSIT